MRINPTSDPQGSGLSLNRAAEPATMGGGVVSLTKGQKVSLTKNNPNLDKIHVGLGWDTNSFSGHDFDLDASVFMVGENEKVPNSSYFIFYNQLTSPEGSVTHTGDNLTGEGEGDDESVKVVLSKVPANIQKVLFTVTIHESQIRRQSFGQVKNAFIRIVDDLTDREIYRFDLTEDFSTETSLVVGELYRHNEEWRFNAVGAGYNTNLSDFCGKYGVQIG